MDDWYKVEARIEHSSVLGHDVDVDDLVHGGFADIQAIPGRDDADEDDASVVGHARFFLVKLGLATNAGLNALTACDAISQDVYEYGSAVLGPDGHFKEEIMDAFELIGGTLLILHTMTILPAHRGRNLGLVAASRIIELFGDGLVVCRPQPLQHVFDTKEHRDSLAPELAYDTFTKDKRQAKAALQQHWSALGFQRVGRSDFYALSTDEALPNVQLREPGNRR